MNDPNEIEQGYRVMIDDNFHYMDESYRVCAGTFQHYEDALVQAKEITLKSVLKHKGASAAETYDNYKDFGDDPFIQPFGEAPRPEENYSAWTTAKMLAQQIETAGSEPQSKGETP